MYPSTVQGFSFIGGMLAPKSHEGKCQFRKKVKKKKSNSANIYIFETGLQAIHLCSQTSLQTVATLFTCNFGVLCNNTLVLDS